MAHPLTEEQKKLATDQLIQDTDRLLNTLLDDKNKKDKESDQKLIRLTLGFKDEQEEMLKQRFSSSIKELIRDMGKLSDVDANDRLIIAELNRIISNESSNSYEDLWENFEKIKPGKREGMFNEIKEELPYKLFRELYLSETPICSLYPEAILTKVSKLKSLTVQHLDLIIENNEHLSPEFCRVIINRLWSGGIIDRTIKDPILSNNGTDSISIENLKKIIVKAGLDADQLKKIVPKLFGGKYSEDQILTICKDSIVAHKKFNVDVANAIIIQINKLNDTQNKADLIKAVLNKLLNEEDKDLPKLVTTLVTTKVISDEDVKKEILDTIIYHKNLTPKLAEILLTNHADLIDLKKLGKIIDVMEDNPNIPRIIFRDPATKKLIGELSDPHCIKLIEKAETAENLETILTAINGDSGIDKRSNHLVDKLVSKLYEGTNPTESIITKTFQSIRDFFPFLPKTNRKQCREILQQQVMTNNALLSKLSKETIIGLLNMKLHPTVRTALGTLLLIAPSRITLTTGNPNITTGNPSAKTKTPTATEGVSPPAAPDPPLDKVARGFTATALYDRDLDPTNDPKMLSKQQLDYDKFIEQIGTQYIGDKNSDATFKIYKQDDTDKKNTLMEKRADGSLVFRKDFGEEEAKLFLESIKSLAETANATAQNKLLLKIDNFSKEQLECISTLVAKPGIDDTTSYKDLLSKVELMSGTVTLDLLPKPPQASAELAVKPPLRPA